MSISLIVDNLLCAKGLKAFHPISSLMALFNAKKKHHQQSGAGNSKVRRGSVMNKLKLIVVGIIIVAILAWLIMYLFGGSSTVISSSYTATLTKQGSSFIIGGTQYVIALSSYSNSIDNGSATIYISKSPLFINPMLGVLVNNKNATRVNYGSEYANMELELISANNIYAKLLITPLPQSLQVTPDYSMISYINNSYSKARNAILQSPSQAATTTVASASGSKPTTTIQSQTSSIPQGTTSPQSSPQNSTEAAIKDALSHDPLYALALNFTGIYSNSTKCTPSLYNTTYINQNHSSPKGPSSYQNVSVSTPYALIYSQKYAGSGNYNIEYIALTRSSQLNNSLTFKIVVNVSSQNVLSDAISGIFSGASQSELSQALSQTESVGNDCAALIS